MLNNEQHNESPLDFPILPIVHDKNKENFMKLERLQRQIQIKGKAFPL